MSSLGIAVPAHGSDDDREPSRAELDAIEAEWPEIEAGLAVVDAMTRMALAERPSELDWRRLRRAEHRALAVRAGLTDRRVADDAPGVA
jgi:hypothetical protein